MVLLSIFFVIVFGVVSFLYKKKTQSIVSQLSTIQIELENKKLSGKDINGNDYPEYEYRNLEENLDDLIITIQYHVQNELLYDQNVLDKYDH